MKFLLFGNRFDFDGGNSDFLFGSNDLETVRIHIKSLTEGGAPYEFASFKVVDTETLEEIWFSFEGRQATAFQDRSLFHVTYGDGSTIVIAANNLGLLRTWLAGNGIARPEIRKADLDDGPVRITLTGETMRIMFLTKPFDFAR